jgi:hypothetical protein
MNPTVGFDAAAGRYVRSKRNGSQDTAPASPARPASKRARCGTRTGAGIAATILDGADELDADRHKLGLVVAARRWPQASLGCHA